MIREQEEGRNLFVFIQFPVQECQEVSHSVACTSANRLPASPHGEKLSLGMPGFPNLPLWFMLKVRGKQGEVSPLGCVHSSEGQESKCCLPERVFSR